MSQPFTDNNGTTFYNINTCRSFSQNLTAGVLTALQNQACSEVIIINTTGSTLSAYDDGNIGFANTLLIPSGAIVEIRGITNAMQVSAIGSGVLSYRTQYFSFNPQR